MRDLLLDRPSPDVDLMVEGDGVAMARRLVEEVSGRLVVHGEFRTARIYIDLLVEAVRREGLLDQLNPEIDQCRQQGSGRLGRPARVGVDPDGLVIDLADGLDLRAGEAAGSVGALAAEVLPT